jgi:hypothetical protein
MMINAPAQALFGGRALKKPANEYLHLQADFS